MSDSEIMSSIDEHESLLQQYKKCKDNYAGITFDSSEDKINYVAGCESLLHKIELFYNDPKNAEYLSGCERVDFGEEKGRLRAFRTLEPSNLFKNSEEMFKAGRENVIFLPDNFYQRLTALELTEKEEKEFYHTILGLNTEELEIYLEEYEYLMNYDNGYFRSDE